MFQHTKSVWPTGYVKQAGRTSWNFNPRVVLFWACDATSCLFCNELRCYCTWFMTVGRVATIVGFIVFKMKMGWTGSNDSVTTKKDFDGFVLFVFTKGVEYVGCCASNIWRSFCSLWGTALRAHASYQVKFVLSMTKLRLLSLKSKLGHTLDKVCGRLIFYDGFCGFVVAYAFHLRFRFVCFYDQTPQGSTSKHDIGFASTTWNSFGEKTIWVACGMDHGPYSEVNAYTRILRDYTGMGWKTIPGKGERLYWEVYSTIPGNIPV